ncbi:MAG: type II toxin-antitoxin system VapC family toxin [Tepidisphaeraceae bacterium]
MLLLDSCVLLWIAEDRTRLSRAALDALGDDALPRYVSAVSAIELGIQHRRGRITLPSEPEKWFADVCDSYGITPIPVTWQIAARSSQLPLIHLDPLDRLLIATATVAGLRIVTPDRIIPRYPDVNVVW